MIVNEPYSKAFDSGKEEFILADEGSLGDILQRSYTPARSGSPEDLKSDPRHTRRESIIFKSDYRLYTRRD